MAKQSGLGDQLFIDGYDIGADTSAIGNISTPRNTLPATGITQSAMARLFGTRDGAAEFTTFFNDATNQEHDALKRLPTADAQVMYLRGQGLGSAGIGLVGKQIDYAPTRGDDGSLTFNVSVQANAYGLDWGLQLTTGKQTFASAANGTGVDFLTGSKSFGFQAYLQVFSIGSGTATVTLQESSDNGVGDAWANVTGGAFTAITGRTTERIQSTSDTLTVERYLRVAVSGTFTNLVCCVVVNRNNATRAI